MHILCNLFSAPFASFILDNSALAAAKTALFFPCLFVGPSVFLNVKTKRPAATQPQRL